MHDTFKRKWCKDSQIEQKRGENSWTVHNRIMKAT